MELDELRIPDAEEEDFLKTQEKATILVVNDDPRQLLAITSLLADLDAEMITAASGEGSLRRLLERDVAVILLDVKMPGMDGFETAALIRARRRSANTPIIFVTAYDSSQTHVSRGYSLGAVDYIHAPIIPEVLRGKITALVELYKKTEQVRRQAHLLREKDRREYERMLSEAAAREEREKERRIAEVLAEKAKELARSNEDLDQFAYLASHDLREPLRTIASYSLELQRRLQQDEAAAALTDRIVHGAELMDRLINDLYTFSQVGRRGVLEWTDFNSVFQAVCANLKAALQESDAEVTCTDLPVVMAVETECVRLLQNLLSNAIKFRIAKPVRVHVSVTQDDEYWLFAVRDNGIGMEPHSCDRIFHVGERLHHRRRYPGSGLGLTICRKIVERHGGRIWAESEPGKGSTFYFTLPVRSMPDHADEFTAALTRSRPR